MRKHIRQRYALHLTTLRWDAHLAHKRHVEWCNIIVHVCHLRKVCKVYSELPKNSDLWMAMKLLAGAAAAAARLTAMTGMGNITTRSNVAQRIAPWTHGTEHREFMFKFPINISNPTKTSISSALRIRALIPCNYYFAPEFRGICRLVCGSFWKDASFVSGHTLRFARILPHSTRNRGNADEFSNYTLIAFRLR